LQLGDPLNNLGPWHTEDFEALSWHDVHVHGLSLDTFAPNEGACDLVLDIDYILNWSESEAGIVFTVCRATLRFHAVFGLKLILDYKSPTAGMSPFSINEIKREVVAYQNGTGTYHWKILVNWPVGSLEFEASEFTQTLVGLPRVQEQQWLEGR
jgi:hypothetical protein